MATKADFDAQEWETIEQGPLMAGLMVMAADRGGTIRETLSVARAYGEARQSGEGELLGELAESPPKLDRDRVGNIGEIETTGPAIISESVSLLESKAPGDVDAFKRFCLDVAEHAAEATKSGGFLGIGGKRISEAESRALDSIADTLGIERGVHESPQ